MFKNSKLTLVLAFFVFSLAFLFTKTSALIPDNYPDASTIVYNGTTWFDGEYHTNSSVVTGSYIIRKVDTNYTNCILQIGYKKVDGSNAGAESPIETSTTISPGMYLGYDDMRCSFSFDMGYFYTHNNAVVAFISGCAITATGDCLTSPATELGHVRYSLPVPTATNTPIPTNTPRPTNTSVVHSTITTIPTITPTGIAVTATVLPTVTIEPTSTDNTVIPTQLSNGPFIDYSSVPNEVANLLFALAIGVGVLGLLAVGGIFLYARSKKKKIEKIEPVVTKPVEEIK